MPDEKVCRQCHVPKPLDDFYVHAQMADGHLNKCKDCVKKRVKGWAIDNPEKVRLATREKMNRPAYRARNAAWRAAHPEQRKAIQDRWYKKNTKKKYANTKVQRALQSGELVKPAACQDCGAATALEAHHHDYSRPLEVQWLCTTCHGKTRHVD